MDSFIDLIKNPVISYFTGVLTALIGVILSFRLRSRTQIRLIIKDSYPLLHKREHSFGESVKLLINDQEISGNVIFVRFGFQNIGNTDLTHDDVFRPIELTLGDGYSFIHVDKSDYVQLDKETGRLAVRWDLFKVRETIMLDAIITCSNEIVFEKEEELGEVLIKNFTFTHKIKNLSKILTTNWHWKTIFEMLLVLGITGGVIFFGAMLLMVPFFADDYNWVEIILSVVFGMGFLLLAFISSRNYYRELMEHYSFLRRQKK